MKKLLFTAIAAAGVAFGLRAADATLPTGTSFEGTTVTDPVDLNGQGEIAAGSYWSTSTGDANQSLKVTAYGSDAKLTGNNRVGYYADQEADQNNYLAIKTTFGKPVTRNVYDAGEAETLVDGGIYFDSLVKMTVCDEAPSANYTDAKILVWAQETAEGDNTNLWVRAGVVTVGTESTTVVPQDFNCGTVENADQWHRLTIKVIKDITRADNVPGFVVFWDKTAQGSTAAKIGSSLNLNDSAATFDKTGCLFASLVQSGGNKGKITGVAFDGQGAVDDLLFTKDVPFNGAEDKEFFSIALGAYVNSFDYTVGGETKTATENTLVPYTAGMTISISAVKCADGYMADALTGDGVEGMDFKPTAKNQSGTVNAKAAAATINGEPYADVASAMVALNGKTVAGTYTLKLFGTAESMMLENATAGVKIVIDLAGQTVEPTEDYAIAVDGADVQIINSTATLGTVNGPVLVNAGTLTIENGKYEGAITKSDDSCTAVINGGKFRVEPAAELAKSGYKFVKNGDYYELAQKVAVTGVTLNSNAETIKVDGTVTLIATVAPETADDKTVTWSSSAEDVATVVDGVVTGIAKGTATITVTTVDGGKTATCTVTVEPKTVAVESVEITGLTEVEVGKTITLTATVKPDDATDKTVTWTSGDTSKATVDSASGVVTGVAAGDVDITATAGDKTDTITITVKAADWPEPTDPSVIGKKASDVFGDKIPTALSTVSAGQFATWAKAAGLDFATCKPEDVNVEAFLFNTANNAEAVEAEQKAFAFTAITPGVKPAITTKNLAGEDYNGTVTVTSYSDAACTTTAVEGDQLFYKATLTPTAAPVKEN